MAAVTSAILSSGWCRVHEQYFNAKHHHLLNPQLPKEAELSIARYDERLDDVLSMRGRGETPFFSLLLSSRESSKNAFFHGGCAYVPEDDELYITSGLLQPTDPAQMPVVLISRVRLLRDGEPPYSAIRSVVWSKLRPPPTIPMPAGAAYFSYRLRSQGFERKVHGVVYCSRGNGTQTGGLHEMESGKPPSALFTDYFGRGFGRVCAVAIRDMGEESETYWFVDGGTRGLPGSPAELPPAIWTYRRRPGHGFALRMMADDVHNPCDLAFSPDGTALYVTDSNPELDAAGVQKKNATAGIYAFDVVDRSGSPCLTGKRLFARPAKGNPRGIVCDGNGNVFVGCDDGVEIWHPDGSLLGVIIVPAPVASLEWGKKGELFICAGQTLWMVEIGENSHRLVAS